MVNLSDVALVNEDAMDKMLSITVRETDKPDFAHYRYLCEELLKRFPSLKTIAFILRFSHSASHNSWSGLLWSEGSLDSAPVYEMLPIVDRLGGGDAFMDGLIYGLRMYKNDPQKALHVAVAAGCLKHSIPGDFDIASEREVEALLSGDVSGRVSR